MPTRATVRSGDGKQARIMPVHELAREAVPHVRAAYVDSDEVAVSQAAAVLGGAGVRAVCADLRDPGAVLADPGLREVIDLARPVALILASVLHFFTAGEAREIVAGYARRVAPGSYVIISVVVSDQDMLRKVRAASGRDDLHSFAIPEIRGLLGGLELVQPGVVPARAWRGGAPDPGLRPSGPAYLMAAVGRVP
jgi:hypothetical protein